MDKLVHEVNWNLPGSKPQQLYMYGEADFESNRQMQEPLEKLYQYENTPDMREKVREYIDKLDAEIKRLENQLEDHMNGEACMVTEIESRLQTLIEVKNDLLGRLDEVI